jgi:hypothetical protein
MDSMKPADADLIAELDALVTVTDHALARLTEGETVPVRELIERRARLLATITACAPSLTASAADQVRRALAHDAEIIALLEGQLRFVGRQLERMARARQSLRSYGSARSRSAVYLERLG